MVKCSSIYIMTSYNLCNVWSGFIANFHRISIKYHAQRVCFWKTIFDVLDKLFSYWCCHVHSIGGMNNFFFFFLFFFFSFFFFRVEFLSILITNGLLGFLVYGGFLFKKLFITGYSRKSFVDSIGNIFSDIFLVISLLVYILGIVVIFFSVFVLLSAHCEGFSNLR